MTGVTVSTQIGLGDLLPLFEKSELDIHVLPSLRRVMIRLDRFTAILMTEMQIGSWQVQLSCKRSKTGKITTMLTGHAETPEEALRIAEALAVATKPDLILDADAEPTETPIGLAEFAED